MAVQLIWSMSFAWLLWQLLGQRNAIARVPSIRVCVLIAGVAVIAIVVFGGFDGTGACDGAGSWQGLFSRCGERPPASMVPELSARAA